MEIDKEKTPENFYCDGKILYIDGIMVTWVLGIWATWVYPLVKTVHSRSVHFNVCKFSKK